MSKCTLCEKVLTESQLICDVCYPDGKKTLSGGTVIRVSDEVANMIQEELDSPTSPTEALVDLLSGEYSPPQPEFELDKLVTKNVYEPRIEFNFGNCKICEIPLTEEYEHVSFCGDCAEELFLTMYSGKEKGLPN